MSMKIVFFLLILSAVGSTLSLAQTPCNKKEIQGWWQLYKVEALDGSIDTAIQEPTYFSLILKSFGRVRGPVFNGESYGHYWGKYRIKKGQFQTSTKVYFPDFIGKNGRDVEIYLRYFNMADSCHKVGDNLVISFSKASVGIKAGRLYYKPHSPR